MTPCKLILLITLALPLFNCAGGRGFTSPWQIDLEAPDGPAEFKAGWVAGCKSGLTMKNFRGSWIYDIDYGNGAYQHDPVFQTAWGQAFIACRVNAQNSYRNASQGDGMWGSLR